MAKKVDFNRDKIYEYFNSVTENGAVRKALREFYENRIEIGQAMTVRAAKMLVKELEKLAPNNDKLKIAIIEQSIYYGWRGVFPLKSTNTMSTGYQAMHNPNFNGMSPEELKELEKLTRINGEKLG